jgi:hypothetical protein
MIHTDEIDAAHEHRILALQEKFGRMMFQDGADHVKSRPIWVNGQRYKSVAHASAVTGIKQTLLRRVASGLNKNPTSIVATWHGEPRYPKRSKK